MTAVKDYVKDSIDTVADRAKGATDSAANTVDRVKQSVGGAMHAVADYANDAKESVKHLASDAGDSAKHAADKVQKWAGEAYDATAHVAGDFGKEVTNIVKKYPIPSILVGFGLGLLIGRVARL